MRVLVLSTTTGYQLRSFGDAAERLGVELAFATDRCHSLDDPWRDAAVAVRFHDERASLAAIQRAAERRPFDGIVAVGDRPVVLAARAAEALGLPGHPPDAAAASANKRLARERFTQGGLRVPWHFAVPTGTPPRAVAARARYPLVVKPIGLSGSRGVIRADSDAGLADALQRIHALLARRDVRAMRTGLEDEILIEGFIPGREYAIEGILTNGEFRALAIFDKPDPLDGPFFEETIYVTPPALPASLEAAIAGETARAVRALGLHHGPIHAECRVAPDGIYILEVAARPIGGLCSRVLRFTRRAETVVAAAEVHSLEDLLLRHAVGEHMGEFAREPCGAAVMMIPIPGRGVLKRVDGIAAARRVPHVEDVRITAKKDQLLEPLPEAGSYLGFIFARAPRAGEAEAAVRAAHGELRFTIAPPIGVVPA